MNCTAFFVIVALLLVGLAMKSRRLAAVTLVGVLSISLLFPTSSYAQLGLISGIQNILDLINGTIHQALNAIGSATSVIQSLHQQLVWPVGLIQLAHTAITNLIAQYRGQLQRIYGTSVRSATLPVPTDLETVMRNEQTADFNILAQNYYRTYGTAPPATDADELARNLIDVDDALALDTLKTLKASDSAGELILQSATQIDDNSRSAAPGSAPFLTAAAVASNIQSQVMMQKMLAAMIRQEAARIAHENASRKRYGMLVSKARQNVSDLLKRR